MLIFIKMRICVPGFQSFFIFFTSFSVIKLATSSKRVKDNNLWSNTFLSAQAEPRKRARQYTLMGVDGLFGSIYHLFSFCNRLRCKCLLPTVKKRTKKHKMRVKTKRLELFRSTLITPIIAIEGLNPLTMLIAMGVSLNGMEEGLPLS